MIKIEDNFNFRDKDTIVVGCSTGPDSMALVDMLLKIRNKYDSDIFGFRDLFYKEDYEEYNNIKSVWYEDIFNDIEVEVKSDIKLVEKGNIVGGIHDQ